MYWSYGTGDKYVLDCHGIIGGESWYSEGYAKRMTDFWVAKGYHLIVPVVDPWNGILETLEVYDELGMRSPILSGQCIGGIRAYHIAGEREFSEMLMFNAASDWGLVRENYRQNVENPDLSRITCPIRIWHGLEDTIVPPGNSYKVQRECLDVGVCWIPGQGHADPIDVYVEGLERYLEGIWGPI